MRSFKILYLCVVWIMFTVIACSGYAAEKIERNKILMDKQEWREVYRAFEVDEALVEAMAAKVGENLKIDVYFGFWCSDSKNNVPPFLKIMDVMEGFNNKIPPVNYYTVQRKPTKETKYFVEEFKVERVPTFIFYRDGKEIGRIVENPKNSLIEDMMNILL
ncbi:MAG: thioredoxin family protein [Candidatus Aminicenantes bacterium]|nr:thioredoxin family protein [Candidatus Aminicenantes bacterium]